MEDNLARLIELKAIPEDCKALRYLTVLWENDIDNILVLALEESKLKEATRALVGRKT